MKLIITLTGLLLMFLPTLGQEKAAVQTGDAMISFSGEAQGTTYHIKYRNQQQRSYQKQVDSLLADIDKALSTYRPDSEIAQVNRSVNHRFQSPHFYAILKKAAVVFRATNGAFDPTIMPLVEAYGFGSAPPKRSDALINIDSLLQYVGFDKVSFDSIQIQKNRKGIRLDLNAIAQGYSVDVVAAFLEQQSIRHYLVEIGGEVRAKGEKASQQPWTVGIEHPLQRGQIYATLKIRDRSMATSGNYHNRKEVNGQVMGHIINPRTGFPEPSALVSATVFASDAATADALATAFIVMGLQATQQFLTSRPDLDAYLLYTDERGQLKRFTTKGLPEL